MMTSLSSPQTARGSHRSILTEKRRGKHDFCQVTILIGVSATLFGFLIRNEKNLHLISINLEEIQEGHEKDFCRMASIAMMIIGVSIIVSGAGTMMFPSPILTIVYGVLFAIGLLTFVFAMKKYGTSSQKKG